MAFDVATAEEGAGGVWVSGVDVVEQGSLGLVAE